MLFILAWVFWLYHNQKHDEGRRHKRDNRIPDNGELVAQKKISDESSEPNHEFYHRKVVVEDDILLKENGYVMSENPAFYEHYYRSAWPIEDGNGKMKIDEEINQLKENPVESLLFENDLKKTFDNFQHRPKDENQWNQLSNRELVSINIEENNSLPIIKEDKDITGDDRGTNHTSMDDRSIHNSNNINTTLNVSPNTHVNSNLLVSLTHPHKHAQLSVNVVDTFVTSPLSSPTRQNFKSEIKLIPSPHFKRKSFNVSVEDEEVASIFRPSDELLTDDNMKYTTEHGVNVSVESEPIGRIHSIVVRPEGRSPIRSIHQEEDDVDYDNDSVHLLVETKNPSSRIQAINVSTGLHRYEDVEEDLVYEHQENVDYAAPDYSDEEYFSDDVIQNDVESDVSISVEEELHDANPFNQYVDEDNRAEEKNTPNPFAQYVGEENHSEDDEDVFDDVTDDLRPITPVPNHSVLEEPSFSENESLKANPNSSLFNKLKSLQPVKQPDENVKADTEPEKPEIKPVVKKVAKKTQDASSDKKRETKRDEITNSQSKHNQSEATAKSDTSTTVVAEKPEAPKDSLIKPRPKKPSFTVEQKTDAEDFMSIMKRRKKYVDTMDDAGRLLGQIANRDVKIHGMPSLSKNWKLIKECVRTKRYLLFKDRPIKLPEPYRRQSASSGNNKKTNTLYGKYRL